MNWYILVPISLLSIALLFFLIKRNQKDEENFEDSFNRESPNEIDEEDK